MRVDFFDFELPEERIALRPVVPRDAARLLVIDANANRFKDRSIRDLPDLLRPGDALVVNDTRVIPARLEGIRVRGDAVARIEVTLHTRDNDNTWRAFARPAKRLQAGERIRFGETSESMACLLAALDASVVAKHESGEVTLAFDLTGPALEEQIAQLGRMPLPPYIASRRATDAQDERDYQTMFAEKSGAVAAPTASLHFTPELIAAIQASGVSLHRITLHVGAGTFLPVKVEDTRDHRMHAEWGEVGQEAALRLNAARDRGGRIVAVGTTSLRLLEAAAKSGVIEPFRGTTDIFITPGHRFAAVDLLFTNFHLPRSTLFMLVAAFAGLERMKEAYAHAITHGYRFYSYGDASLLFPAA